MTVQRDPERNERKALNRLMDFKGKHVLEIGCGEGRLTWQYAAACARVTGVDLDLTALRIARADAPASVDRKVQFSAADSGWLPFPREKFDLAVLAWSL